MRRLLEVTGAHLWRGERHVLRGISLRLAPGEAVQLLWPNGAGKTSLLRAIAGLLPLESGDVLWQGSPTRRDHAAYCRDMAYLGHDLALKGDLTAAENLLYLLPLRRAVTRAQVVDALARVGLTASPDELVRRLSAGQQRRVALARLVLWEARLWLLDEPAANLDAPGQSLVTQAIASHLTGGGAVVLATHQALALPPHQTRLWHSPAEAA